jgi:hypothetical protein
VLGRLLSTIAPIWPMASTATLAHVRTVIMWPKKNHCPCEGLTCLLMDITVTVSNAALHYVFPTNRSLCLQFGVIHPGSAFPAQNIKDASNDWLETSDSNILHSAQASLQASIPCNLPAGCRLISVDTVITDLFYSEHRKNGLKCVWSIEIEPCQ